MKTHSSMNIKLLYGRPVLKEGLPSALCELSKDGRSLLQAIDAKIIVCDEHATFAAKKAMLAIQEGRNAARDPGIEILRYASGSRQIERAMKAGVTSATNRIALIVVGDIPEGLDDLIEFDGIGARYDPQLVKTAFQITDEELEAVGPGRLADLVIERVALVDAYR
jgi:KEOPS complex subunit Cgi121